MTLPHEELRVGTTLSGKYLIEKRLGAGAVGEVYRAKNVLLARDVAIKFLRREHARNAEIVERFLREARAASSVQHPHVVDVLDVGTDDDTPYIVQELLLGEDLGAHLERKGGRLAPSVAVALMLPAIDGVAAAHARGVVHRDLKPENVFLARTPDGIVPKVLDFGVSKMPTSNARATVAGAVFGTPGYMAPEQVMSFASADARADVWSLGVMLYELISGRLPWDFTEPQALLVAVCTTAPRPLPDAAPETPSAICDIVARCLLREPAGRFASAAELSSALRAAGDGPARVTRLQFVAMSMAPPEMSARPSAAPIPLVRSRPSATKPARASVARPSRTSEAGDAPWELDLQAANVARREREVTLKGRVSDIAHLRPSKPRAPRALPAIAAALSVTAALSLVALAFSSREATHAAPHAAAAHTSAPAIPTPIVTAPAVASAPTSAPAVEPPSRDPVAPAALPRAARPSSHHHADADPTDDAPPSAAPEGPSSVPEATPAELDASVQRAAAQNMSQSVSCIERARVSDPNLVGRLAVRLTVGPTGRVRTAEPVASGRMLPLARCLARAMASWSLDRSGGDRDAVVTWPFTLAGGDGAAGL